MSDDPEADRPAGTPPSHAEQRLRQANLRLRADLLREMPVLDVGGRMGRPHQAGVGVGATEGVGSDVDPAQSLWAWLDERRLFGVEWKSRVLVSVFQLDASGQPRAVVGEILTLLPQDMTAWQVAFWFASANGWLGGDYPCERLDDRDAVLLAARRLAEGTIG
ncbi:hypothetical protein Rumeso_04058 [Rubellimicrobium mesophilum DSM 19309]|uniref:Uncharacterized protein n=1 Tax=Rubellimicrobium mesophilum DSM 19309 TaxID=442562 RepID=A0A017HJM3_9RHOB|nr:hypothetical protein [Rubellimicrobium mesophilum]EYD74373.1 hypothetical protein Rumeso_04058 [Rubellimicrobium mesophilum DSM 19309]